MYYRTRTYLAGDWDGDKDLIETIDRWKCDGHLKFDYPDAHDITQSKDSSLYCTIKSSLSVRLNASKKFVLIVGDHTNTVTKGSCQYCPFYSSNYQRCDKNKGVDYRSFIKYECEKAHKDYYDGVMDIIVIYNSTKIDRSKCPEAVRNIGDHYVGRTIDSYGNSVPDYQTIKKAIMG